MSSISSLPPFMVRVDVDRTTTKYDMHDILLDATYLFIATVHGGGDVDRCVMIDLKQPNFIVPAHFLLGTAQLFFKRERYRDDDDEISVGVGLEEEVNALDDVDSDAEPLDCN
ncbi:hypothetical protein Tco_0313531 [Tanacetum coccineum]